MAVISPVSLPQLKSIRGSPLTLWHLLSLDAPTVAAFWTWFIASANHLRLPVVSVVSMFLAVWMLYAADRILDARLIEDTFTDDLEARHYFHLRHRTSFLAGIGISSVALAILLPRLESAAIPLYLILGGLLSGYFILIHATRSAHRLPKEIAVGLFFAAAVFIPTVARRPDLRFLLLPPALLFAILCSLNCLYIYTWEHPTPHNSHPAHAATRFALSYLQPTAIAVISVSIALSFFDHSVSWQIPAAIAASTALLLLLHGQRRQLARTTLRAMADLALITPLLLLLFQHR